MTQFRFSRIFSLWFDVSIPPQQAGWYRVRNGPNHPGKRGCSGMAYFNGQLWWTPGEYVFQWQGLACPWEKALARVEAHKPNNARAREAHEKKTQYYFAHVLRDRARQARRRAAASAGALETAV